jgi:hypothetical protein
VRRGPHRASDELSRAVNHRLGVHPFGHVDVFGQQGAGWNVRQLGQEISHVVALQVAFERQTLKPVFSLDSF